MPEQPFSRRRFVAASLTAATVFKLRRAARAAGLKTGAEVCTLLPEQEVGPYYIADELLRADIVEGKPGVPLSLRIVVLDSRTCTPLPQAAVDLWHCDALGLYSGFTEQNPMGPGRPRGPGDQPPENRPTDQLTFLRGIQLTGDDGVVDFHTIFPGVYRGRTNHIHFKVRVGGQADGHTYQAGHAAHAGQIFFPEELAAGLMQREPYRRQQVHRTTQGEDHVYGDQQGELSVARIEAVKAKDLAAELKIHAELIAAVDPAATPAEAGRRGGPRRGPRY
jgi:protocatechuate 3,4-dioxygenase beta subunit